MQDKDTELNYYPKAWLSPQGYDRVLCVAPHPDDEVLGCGGALILLANQGAHVQSLILTGGDKALGMADPEHGQARRIESTEAARVMGTRPPQFLDFQDRHLCYGESLVQAILEGLQHLPASTTGLPALLFLPSLSEPHPDHQASALAGMAAAQRWGHAVKILFCEIGAPLQPNIYLDITSVAEQKSQAVAKFKSQLGLENYAELSRAMGILRAFGKAPECTAAEAYFQVDMDAVRRTGPLAALPQWPWIRSRLQLANDPQDLPMVSILIRSMNRSSLAETLASVAQQTYSNIEVVLVNASGQPHDPVAYLPEHLNVRLIHPEGQARLGRSSAANEALVQARGSLALFLDDDDLIAPDHLQRLVQTLYRQDQAVAAYSGVRVVNSDGQVLRDYDIPWCKERLQGINFLPIHAVLFRMQEVHERHLKFDTSLPVLEDWDFWRQLGQNKAFVHSQGITATYRQGLGQSGLSEPGHDNHWQKWHLQLLTRYLTTSATSDIAKCLAWHAIELDKTSYQIDLEKQKHQTAQQQLQQTVAELQRHTSQSLQHQAARDQLQLEMEKYSLQVQVKMAEKEAKLHAFAAECNKVLADKEQAMRSLSQETRQVLVEKDHALAEKDHALAEKERQLQQLEKQLRISHGQFQQLQAWTHSITRWLPSFLIFPKDKR